jgi:dipeptidyl aminopeptidase/acylaminoacyl peptidase
MGGGVTSKAIVVDPRIRAAVLYAPVSGDETDNLAKWGGGMLERLDPDDGRRAQYVAAMEDPDFIARVSPIHAFEAVSAPVQIHQGTADTVTPPEWAEAIYEALLAAGADVEIFRYPGQNHAFQGQAWTQFLERITAFYRQELGEGG